MDVEFATTAILPAFEPSYPQAGLGPSIDRKSEIVV